MCTMRSGFIFLFLVSLSYMCNGQISDLRGGGAAVTAQGKIYSVLGGADGIFGNSASMPDMKEALMIDAGVERRFGLADLSVYSLAVVKKLKRSAFGINLVNMGDQEYLERKLQASFSMKLTEVFNIGANFNMLQLSISDYGQTFTPSIDLGILTKLTEKIAVGIFAQNIATTKQETISYPTILALGVDYKLSEKVGLKLEAEKILDRSIAIKSALKYAPQEKLNFMLGVDTQRQNMALGISYQLNGFKIIGAYTLGNVLNSTPALNLRYLRN